MASQSPTLDRLQPADHRRRRSDDRASENPASPDRAMGAATSFPATEAKHHCPPRVERSVHQRWPDPHAAAAQASARHRVLAGTQIPTDTPAPKQQRTLASGGSREAAVRVGCTSMLRSKGDPMPLRWDHWVEWAESIRRPRRCRWTPVRVELSMGVHSWRCCLLCRRAFMFQPVLNVPTGVTGAVATMTLSTGFVRPSEQILL